MQKTQLGTKRVCPSCGARFYDLAKRPIGCPKCGFSFEPDQIVRARKPRVDLREAPVRAKVEPDIEEIEVDADEEAEDDGLLETDDEDEDAEIEVEVPIEEAVAKKPARKAKRAPALEEEDVGVLPDDDDEEEEDVEVIEDEDDVLVVDDEISEDELSDIIEDDGDDKDGPV